MSKFDAAIDAVKDKSDSLCSILLGALLDESRRPEAEKEIEYLQFAIKLLEAAGKVDKVKSLRALGMVSDEYWEKGDEETFHNLETLLEALPEEK